MTSSLSGCGHHYIADCHRRRRYSTSPKKKASDPLHILFCGSDEFSCASLEALHREHVQNPDLIRSIEVVVRPGKRTGRGYKTVRDPPLRSLANELNLPIHERDTFTGWDMPPTTNLIIAVSFGLFVPPRLLRGAKYGGLNLHPSLLPDLRGPAPLQHALLAGRSLTGVSLQTLDARAFDRGLVLAQTPADAAAPGALVVPPGPARGRTVPALLALVTPVAARLLVDGLRDGLHVPPLEDRGWWARRRRGSDVNVNVNVNVDEDEDEAFAALSLLHAPKITKEDRRLSPSLLLLRRDGDDGGAAAAVLARRQAAIGPLWFWSRDRRGRRMRVIVEDLEELPPPPTTTTTPFQPPNVIAPAAVTTTTTTEEKVEEATPLAGSAHHHHHHPGAPPPPSPRHRRYLVPLEDGDGDGGSGARWNLVFWDGGDVGAGTGDTPPPVPGSGAGGDGDGDGDGDGLYLGNCRVRSLKVEGDKARPARLALRNFFVD
ncbi:putative methionyl-tRNA formyltransferase [Rosellinia necatrix]|uniref:methionyl-tRNA formyltransferase n=1 Tax=Rosellinia necatrix TaxID=77044 RepID=A0A1S7UMD0_ROSNE|nr:putative methionyl-tRNA formyltransferase [Rosellinia necatrix]